MESKDDYHVAEPARGNCPLTIVKVIQNVRKDMFKICQFIEEMVTGRRFLMTTPFFVNNQKFKQSPRKFLFC